MKPRQRPRNPSFGSGPTAKRPGWSVGALEGALFARSHRSGPAKKRLAEVIDRSRALLGLPGDYRLGIVPGSNTGAFEMALWTLLGPLGVDVLSWESFGAGWVTDVEKQLKIEDLRKIDAPYGELPDLTQVDFSRDVVFVWNGTTSGVRVPNGDWIPRDREGLTLSDATSAVFGMEIPFERLDAFTYSWQKVLGGEAAHGMLALGPRAVERLESATPPWPLPKVFRLTKGGKLNEGVFRGETINSPSMLCVEDALDGLRWAEREGGGPALLRRTRDNCGVIEEWVRRTDWVDFLAARPEIRSPTSICLRIVDPAVTSLPAEGQGELINRIVNLLSDEGVAFDIAAYRDAPPGLRIWGGATAEAADLEALTPWIDWAFGRRDMAKVLIADKLSSAAAGVFNDRGIEAVVKTGLTEDQLVEIIGDFDGVAVRSATKVTRRVLESGEQLRVVGRAGVGVDNIDVPAATARGIVVMNTPYGNSVTTAEHAIALMLATARQIAAADRSTRQGKWEKSRFIGMELQGKTLGLIGCGNIGSIVASRAQGLGMRVIASDPFLSPERVKELGVERVELDELLGRADVISLHTPLNDSTRNILSAGALKKTRPGIRIVNCARGGLMDEAALAEAIRSGHVASAALDVFATEPPGQSPLFELENVVVTPHLGASTGEAQEKVAVQVAQQMADFLIAGAVANAVNTPSILAEEAPLLRPYIELARVLGSLAGQITESGLKGVTLTYSGHAAALNHKPLTASALEGLLSPLLESVNAVNAPVVARERNIDVTTVERERAEGYEALMRLTVLTERGERTVAGTLFQGGGPRIVEIQGIPLEARIAPRMLYTRNSDKPGFIGALGTTLGDAGINIASFHLGRNATGDAIALIDVDQEVPKEVMVSIRALPHVIQARALHF